MNSIPQLYTFPVDIPIAIDPAKIAVINYAQKDVVEEMLRLEQSGRLMFPSIQHPMLLHSPSS